MQSNFANSKPIHYILLFTGNRKKRRFPFEILKIHFNENQIHFTGYTDTRTYRDKENTQPNRTTAAVCMCVIQISIGF